MNIKIITDSSCDLPFEYIENNKDILECIGMPIQIEGKEYIDDLGRSFEHDEFYNLLRAGIMPTTSQINAYRFEDAFKENLKKENKIIYIGFSSNMSGTFQSAKIGKDSAMEDFPNGEIYLVDTLAASIGLGVLVMTAIDLARKGNSIDYIVNYIEENLIKTNHWFGVDDLNYLKNGGRISSASAMVGNMLNVKPLLTVDENGKLSPYGKVRGRKKSIQFLKDKLVENYEDNKTEKIIIGHGNCVGDALLLKKNIEEIGISKDIVISQLSMTIASHVGPNMLALAFIGKKRN